MTHHTQLISIEEVANRLDMHQPSVHLWRRKGYIASDNLPNDGYLVPVSELERVTTPPLNK